MRRARAVAGCILAAITIVAISARAQDVPLEHAVKAAFIPKFAPFVDWPESSLAEPGRPLVICAAGNDTVSKLLDEVAKGQTHLGHPILVRAIQAPAALAQCHMLYVAGLRDDVTAAFLEAARGRPILTITNAIDEHKPRGVIDFSVLDKKVRFDIDLVLAAQQGLTISSKLLSLALRVRTQQ